MTESQSLHDLIRAIGSGDPSAFETIYITMREPLCNHVLMRYGSILGEQDAEDVIQNVFLKIPREARSYKGLHNEASARGWLYAIVRSEAMKMVKAKKRVRVSLDGRSEEDCDSGKGAASHEDDALLHDYNWEAGNSVENRAERAGLLKQVFSIPQLSLEDRDLLRLRYAYGYTFDELGQHIGRTKPRAKQKHDGILEKIRKALGIDSSDG